MFFFQLQSLAITHNSVSLGVGYFSENNFGKITEDDSGKKTDLGTTSYPLLLSYDYELYENFYVSPKIMYTLLPRKENGDLVKNTFLHIVIPFGRNFGLSDFDWSIGPGILRRTMNGSGGVILLNNGNSTDPFAAPGRTVTSQVVTFNMGVSYNYNQHSAGFDVIAEGLFSEKRTWNFMLSYMYEFHFWGSNLSRSRGSPNSRSSGAGARRSL